MNANERDHRFWIPKIFKLFQIIFIFSYFTCIYFLINKTPYLENTLLNSSPNNNTYFNEDLRSLQVNSFKDNYERLEKNILIDTFILETNTKEYKGNWELKYNSTSLPDTKQYMSEFKHTEGEIIFKIYVLAIDHMNTFDHKKLIFEYEIKDGKYKDKWISIKQEFSLNTVNLNSLYQNDLEFEFNHSSDKVFAKITSLKTNIITINSIITRHDLYQTSDSLMTNANDLNMIFMNHTYNYLEGNLQIYDAGLDIKFSCKENYNFTKEKKINNFTLVLTLIGILHIYNSLQMIKEILLNSINPQSFSTLFVASNLIWNSLTSIGCFYTAVSFPLYFTDFAVPSVIFFIDFSVFQIRFMFLVWRFQNIEIDLSRENEASLRKKMFKFYLILYVCLFSSLFMMYYIILYKWILLSIIILTFIPQIYHNTKVNIARNKIPFKTILIVTLNRFFFPLYFRLCPVNVFETEPDYIFCSIVIGSIIFEIFILYLQGKYGGLFFIPKTFRPGYFDYYKSYEQIKTLNPDFESCCCSICLNPFTDSFTVPSTTSNDFNSGTSDLLINEKLTLAVTINKVSIMDKFKKCIIRKSRKEDLKLIVTPCKHIFHHDCIKVWSDRKSECPVCRKVIPCIYD